MQHSNTIFNENTALTKRTAPPKLTSQLLREMLKTVHRKLHAATAHWREDDEHVHQLRVSVRRALAAIHFFEDLIPDPCEDWFRKNLKAVLRATRLARDLDVMIKERLSECDKSKLNLLQKCHSKRKSAQRAIVAIHQKLGRKDTFRKHTRKLVRKLRLDAADETANQSVSGKERYLQRFQAIANQFSKVKWGSSDVAGLHRLRIKIKQFRYTAEIVEQVTDIPNLGELMTALSAIQQQLGLLQDHVAARKQIQKLMRSEKNERHIKNLCQLAKDENLAITRCVEQFRDWLKCDEGRGVIQCLENIFPTHDVVQVTKRI